MRRTSPNRSVGRSQRVIALLGVGAMVLSACGSRLTEDEIAAYAAAGGGGAVADGAAPVAGGQGDAPAGTDAPGSTTGSGRAAEPGTTAGGTAAPVDVGDDGTTTTGGAGGAQDPGDPGDPDGGAQDDGPPADPGGEAAEDPGSGDRAPAADTRSAPPGGNGGATDVGVSEDAVRIYNVADLTGAVPGLFRDAYEATLAYVQYFTATEGTIYGRRLDLVSRDTGLSSQGNRSAYLDACDDAFAAVGSTSAFEEGAAEPLQGCGMPDLRNVPTSRALQELDNVFGLQAFRVGDYSRAEWEYYAEAFPDAVTNAAFVWLENQTTNYQTGLYMKGTTESLGYSWNARIQISTSETNYARVVNELKSKDIQMVAFQGAYQQADRLVKAMDQQDYAPQVLALQQNIYTPDLIATCGALCDEYVMVAQNAALLEEMDANPELQLYAEWLARVNPRARPTGLGMYSWASAKLFVQALKDIGPELTRAKLLEYLEGVQDYDADGLIPPQDVGTQEAAGCIVMLDIEGGQFVRVTPDQGYRCSAGRVTPD